MRALRRHHLGLCRIALVAVVAGALLRTPSMGAVGAARVAWKEVGTVQRASLPAWAHRQENVAPWEGR